MSRDKKIEKINAYQKLLSTGKLPNTKDDPISAEIQTEFRSWVEAQLSSLLGEGVALSSGQSLTDEEIGVLKALVQRATKKISAASSESKNPSTAIVKDRAKDPGAPMPRPNIGGKDLLSALEEMDRMGARYLEE